MRCLEGDAPGGLARCDAFGDNLAAEKILPTTVEIQFEFNYHGHA
jgi:hypothetical protein